MLLYFQVRYICWYYIYLMLHKKRVHVFVVPDICCSKNPTTCTWIFIGLQYAWTYVITRHGIEFHSVTMGSYKFYGWVSWSCFNCVITQRLRVTVNPQSLQPGKLRHLCSWHGRRWARMPTVQHAQYGEIERGGDLSEDDFQVAVVEGGRGCPRRLFQRLVVFKACSTETNLLGNQQWHLHQLHNGVWGGDGKRDIRSALIRKCGLVCQRWQGSPESNSTQSAEGSECDEILRKCLTQEEERGRHPVQAGLYTHTQTSTHAYISNKAHHRSRACNRPCWKKTFMVRDTNLRQGWVLFETNVRI